MLLLRCVDVIFRQTANSNKVYILKNPCNVNRLRMKDENSIAGDMLAQGLFFGNDLSHEIKSTGLRLSFTH